MDEKTLNMIKYLRAIEFVEDEKWDGTKEQAIRWADKFTNSYGMDAFVIRKGKKYEWVTEYYFDTYDYEGKIYYESKK